MREPSSGVSASAQFFSSLKSYAAATTSGSVRTFSAEREPWRAPVGPSTRVTYSCAFALCATSTRRTTGVPSSRR